MAIPPGHHPLQHGAVRQPARHAALPLKRMAHRQDVANAVCFAASDRASYICGSVITVDGNSTQGVYL